MHRLKNKLNVLFILTDDFQSNAIHTLGRKDVHTPNIDYLYSQGTAFTNCYTNGAIGGAQSMPSRAMLMTGRGVFDIVGDGRMIPTRHTTLPEHLRSKGYRTFETGKWHSDYAAFRRSFSDGDNMFLGGMHQYHQGGHTAPHLRHYDAKNDSKVQKPFVADKFSSEMFADAAIDFIKTTEDNSAPFFAYVAFTSPHDPHHQHPDYGTKYTPDTLTLPPNYSPRHAFDNGELTIRDEMVAPAPRSKETIREQLSFYYGMISEVDVQIGRIIKALKESGKLDNTVVIFSADNGLAMGQHGLMGKQNLYNHSARVPLLIWAPGIPKAELNDGLCYLYDVNPTISELIGIPSAESVTGKSLASAAKNGAKGKTQRDKLWLTYSSIQRALVKDEMKYIIYNVKGEITEQLFDLKNDPWEMTNLLEGTPSKKTMKIKRKYRDMLIEEMKKGDDFCDLNRFTTEHPSWWDKKEKITWNDGLKLYK